MTLWCGRGAKVDACGGVPERARCTVAAASEPADAPEPATPKPAASAQPSAATYARAARTSHRGDHRRYERRCSLCRGSAALDQHFGDDGRLL